MDQLHLRLTSLRKFGGLPSSTLAGGVPNRGEGFSDTHHVRRRSTSRPGEELLLFAHSMARQRGWGGGTCKEANDKSSPWKRKKE